MGDILIKCGFQTNDGQCGYHMPDTMRECTHINTETECSGYTNPYTWDDKFGLIETKGKPRETTKEYYAIDGVGKDAEIVTNSQGGKQSKSPMAMHLLDPVYLEKMFEDLAERLEYEDEGESTCVDPESVDIHSCYRAIQSIAEYMRSGVDFCLTMAMDNLCSDELLQATRIAKVLQYGAGRYEPNNWRLIPEEEHLNHALIHLVAHLMGDTQDEHLDHALCRLMMAKATEKSENFEYNKYVKKSS